jgi:hypothetical protein
LPRAVSRSRDIRLSATACARHARPVPRAADGEPPGHGHGRADDHGPPNADPATALPADWQHCPAGHSRKRFLAPGTRPLRDHRQPGHPPASPADRYEQPEQPHRMTRGGSSWSRTFSNSARPSVSSAPRVAGKTDRIGRPRPPADLDHDLRNVRPPGDLPAPTARTGTRTHGPAQVRTDLPAHRCEATTTHTAPAETTPAQPGRPSGTPSPARRHAGSPETRSQSMTQPGRRRAHVAADL